MAAPPSFNVEAFALENGGQRAKLIEVVFLVLGNGDLWQLHLHGHTIGCGTALPMISSWTSDFSIPEGWSFDDSDLVLPYDKGDQTQDLGQTLPEDQVGPGGASGIKQTGAMPKTQSNRASLGTPLSQLQSSISQQSMSMKEMRKITSVKPAKPIEPELCLEHIWTENIYGVQRELCEMATRAFIHTDLVGQTFLCYLLARSCRLQMVRLTGYGSSEVQLSTLATTLAAKDAVGLSRLQMVLDPSSPRS
ncbi:uncharacterized protein LOC110184551 [Drosophila serrata]|uniref:uncharacterized protein LOC110184551 n=1 Tax=Drosophila serrata TaxID=7274 RepID=UPI000A1D1083|nr:uncharacterized protein LOC110184551 [Drosophila serrata]